MENLDKLKYNIEWVNVKINLKPTSYIKGLIIKWLCDASMDKHDQILLDWI